MKIIEKPVILGTTKRQRKPYGTIIEISNLKSNWTPARVERVQKEIGKLQPIFSKEESEDFVVWIYKNNKPFEAKETYKEK